MKRFISGFLLGAMLFSVIGAVAVSYVANPVDFKVLVNGREFISDPPALEVDGRTYLPLRAMGEALGVPVNWNEELRQAEVGDPSIGETDDVLNVGDVITVADVAFTYEGYYKNEHNLTDTEHFTVTNNSNRDVKLTLLIVGTKKDGSYELLGTAAFGGIDWERYETDMKENNWATHHRTNTVESGGKLEVTADIMDFGDSYSMDVDRDGYYDVVFQVIPLNQEGGFTITGNEPESGVYKLKVR